MNPDLGSFFRLLETLEGEARGRESSRPPREVELLLDSLLAGELSSDEERRKAFTFLRAEPDWLAWFADRIKSRRKPSCETE